MICHNFICMRTLSEILNEKLKINKDFKNIKSNNDFYTTFKKDIQSITLKNLWSIYTSASDIMMLQRRDFSSTDKYNELIKNFDDFKSTNVIFFTWTEEEILKVTYNSMMDFIFNYEDGMEFKMKETYKTSEGLDYYIYIFETDDALIGLEGPPRVYNGSDYGHIIFRYK